MFVLERERHQVLLREAELERLARARGSGGHRLGPAPRRRLLRPRIAVRIVQGVNRRLADAVR